ncbi:hypothetical protein [Cohnella cellulosilytica]|uniref:Uncharacterized protein n=2 Tax=Cohnella cellulosilytica TaxID=986710 RepID=A0ABW2FJQ2_9BACL
MKGRLFILLLFVMSMVACTNTAVTSDSSEKVPEKKVEPIIDVVQFAHLTKSELISKLGDPESTEDWVFDSANGQKYNAVTLTYDDELQEFMLIDDKVVRFTLYGSGQVYDKEHVLEQFGIDRSPNLTKVADTGSALRYQRVDKSMNVDDFWLIEGTEKGYIETLKVTYDSRYF